MTDKNRPNQGKEEKTDEQKSQGVQPNPGVGQRKTDDADKKNNQGNAAGQGNEGDEVMPAGRETPG